MKCDLDWTALAAWIQAIGSVAAIVAAIVIGKRSDQRARDLVESERNRQGRMVIRAFGLKLGQLLNQTRKTRDMAPGFLEQLGDLEPYALVQKDLARPLFNLDNVDDLDRFRDQALLVDGDIGMFILDVIEVSKMHNRQINDEFDRQPNATVSAHDLIKIVESAIETNKHTLDLFENTAGAIRVAHPGITPTL